MCLLLAIYIYRLVFSGYTIPKRESGKTYCFLCLNLRHNLFKLISDSAPVSQALPKSEQLTVTIRVFVIQTYDNIPLRPVYIKRRGQSVFAGD